MAQLRPMPSIIVDPNDLAKFGQRWLANGNNLKRTPPESSLQFGNLFDKAVGSALSKFLGDIPIVAPVMTSLTPAQPDCVEVGPVRIVGGVRPQNFDVGYRPDGPRFAFDSKTLNDTKSLGKNFLNMINDLATEATTVHSRFPYALVAFTVVVPKPCILQQASRSVTALQTLERLARRYSVKDPDHMAEAISVVIWNPDQGTVDAEWPNPGSPLRIEKFSQRIEEIYLERYKGLPPHGVADDTEGETEPE